MNQHDAHTNISHDNGRLPRWVLQLGIAATFAAMLWPALSNKYPLSADYLNHLSRIYILYHRHDPFLRKIFEVHFGIVPNLALDAIAFTLQPFGFTPNIVMKTVFVLSCLALWSGMLAFIKSVHGKLTAASLLILPLSYSLVLAYGFYDFMLGIGMFLWCFSWIVSAKPSVKTSLIVINLASALIFFCHFGAWLILLVSLFLYHTGLYRKWSRALALTIGQSILPMLFYVFRVRNHFSSIAFGNLPFKILGLISSFEMSSAAIALGTSAIFIGLLTILLYLRAIHLDPKWRRLIIGLGILSLVAPSRFEASYMVDWRLIWITVLLFVMTARFQLDRPLVESVILGSVAAIMIPNVSALIHYTKQYDENIHQFAQAIHVIPKHSFVFVSSRDPKSCPNLLTARKTDSPLIDASISGSRLAFMYYKAVPALVTPIRQSVYPYIFAQRGAEAVFFRKAYSKYFSPVPHSPIPSSLAADFVSGNIPPSEWKTDLPGYGSPHGQEDSSPPSFLDRWTRRFNYLVNLNNGCGAQGSYSEPSKFKVVASGSYFTIYKVTHNP